MIVTTTWQGKRAFTSEGDSGYAIGMDATPAYGGEGKGATPMELLLAGLAGCIGIDVTMILDHFLDQIDRLDIVADGTRKTETPSGFTHIALTFHVDGRIPDYRIWKAIELGSKKYCAVSDSLKAEIDYRLVLNGEPQTRP
ncbi:OsmC family protein [Paenibacillus pasadenensis]|uniref:OsmC/Ohr family protein n=1 Tax=Paenibacillus pasadenensis TaxID=217090 RepID=A0A2N5NDC1_9BACL|nr:MULTISPECIES: OsmC family protein [Paenibacillus]PLT48270.1 OsmC/Ohr family protein [Paenibacillus pasadenensis]QGG58231.1 OsmC family peroxiredoxin [Paenibacillus sp. B01]